MRFNPRAPHGARQLWPWMWIRRTLFQSTRPARGATGTQLHKAIHYYVSIHAPRTGRDAGLSDYDGVPLAFQSTRPARGATPSAALWVSRNFCFNPRAPHGARLPPISSKQIGLLFQSTRPARGATSRCSNFKPTARRFNPRAPHGARHHQRPGPLPPGVVSIHAPRTGRDAAPHRKRSRYRSVSIHAPRTGRDARIRRNS